MDRQAVHRKRQISRPQRLEVRTSSLLRVLGSASRALIKSEYRLTRKGRDARTCRQPRSEVRTAPVWPQFPPSSPTSALCSDQKRKLQLKGRKCEEGKIWIFPGALPQGLLLLATWSFWFPKAQTAIWLTFQAALSRPVAGDRDIVVAQTDLPATSVFRN